MRKSKVIIIALIVAVIASIVVWCVVSSNAKDEKVQQEIDAVVKVLDEASGDSANPAEVGGSETSRELASESGASPIESGDSIDVSKFDLEKTIRLFHILDAGYEKSHNIQEYLQFLAVQDYRGIPPEVIRAKRKLIPYF